MNVGDVWVDPPSGWQYGFPKVKTDPTQDMEEWLLLNGYPLSLVEQFNYNVPCGMWEKIDYEP